MLNELSPASSTRARRQKPARLLGAVALLWIGIVLGVALAAAAKFEAPSLTFPVALDVGMHVFARLHQAQAALAALAVLFAALARLPWSRLILLAVALWVLLLQSAWLLPALDARATQIIAGGQQSHASPIHVYYVIAEGVKLISLALLAWQTLRRTA